jgi:hypothetical protein
MFMVVMHWVSNGKDMVAAPTQLQVFYTNVRQCEEMIHFINKNGGSKEPYIIALMFKCTTKQNELKEEYMRSYTNG